ncbi:ABC transporter ATP-binding protein [Liquorilactobacillus mali]|uniref:Glycerol-3-phosphate-transporting ATPase n=1 Tax=Liquorilactobacillus mali KCTC 3596 = DSM 20444 TaxID=1046596 RepID=J1F3C3_9LACO|nr:ABC transporter ATP-binding protein [Liquorilactobacillus mali]EJE99838.1 glycerol-3-phosphate-transporting ATPase [Liquorilactobacillus mali KCTC 3596 = DSM 20444]KRN10313.1 glycerol-3-phosphate-transporting ATPase [Liquorilactobacillus mali KCTC 3596 = DSM 20444]QFQ75530.1 ABC transporter ATP-binding protein [Liquorilactobacillus mali]
MSNKVILELNDVTKNYKKTNIIRKMNLQVKEGEFLVMLGPSGCGKSTTLRMIAGLEAPSTGEILIDGRNSEKISSFERNIAMVFQDYALYPNMTVYQNLEYSLKVHKVKKEERQKRLEAILETLNLTAYRDRLPGQLSGGQKQRVALGRGMVKQSKIFLLDEPLSNIDVQLREKARDEIQALHEKNHQTIVYVTHDQLEAMALGDRIAIINDGIIQMIDTPDNIYNHPTNLFVAQFIGTPKINTLEVTYDQGKLLFNEEVVLSNTERLRKLALASNRLCLGIRPEHVIVKKERTDLLDLPAQVETVVDYGRYQQLTLNIKGNQSIKAIITNSVFVSGDKVYFSFVAEKILLFDYENKKNLEN